MGNIGGKKATQREHPGLVLDRVASQPSAEQDFPLYRLANYRKGGELLELYYAKGIKEVEKMVQTQLKLFMYNDGDGKIMTEDDRNKWKHKQNGEVCVAIDDPGASANADDNDYAGSNHSHEAGKREVCWSLEYRGGLGETLLHVLLICDSKPHLRIAKLLLKIYPKLGLDIIEGAEFYGVSALHLAIAYSYDDLSRALVTSGVNVNQRATGLFFFPTDQQNMTKSPQETNYDGLAYFGEYPLAWAAGFENEAIYNFLIDRGADPNIKDTLGNMVLHMLVINDKLSMYGYALRHPKSPAKNDLTNNAGLTPLTLACTLGRNEIFREMLELSSVEFWRYSNITCSAYPLNAVDTILPNGKTNWKSALMIILRGSSDQHLDMLEGGVVQRLLEDKWKTFARRQFLIHLVILFQHLVTLSIAVYLRPICGRPSHPEDCEQDRGDDPFECGSQMYDYSATDAASIIRYCTEIASILSSSNYVILQQGQEIWAQGIRAYAKTATQSPAKLIFLIANLFILLCIPCRFFQLRLLEDIFISVALPGSWFFLIFFAGAIRLTGPFVTMIYNMIAGDMVRFGIIYLIMLLGFSQAFYFLFKDHENELEHGEEYDTYYGTWMMLFHMTLGAYEYGNFDKTHYVWMTRITFVVFMIMVPILLLNMLIAMMGNTYIQVINKSEKEFVKQWANIVLTLERSLSQKKAAFFLDAYAINLKPATETEEQVKGLMVIKSKNISKAKQRNRALRNWKRTRTAIKNKLEKYNCRGQDLLDIIKEQNAPKGGKDDDSDATPGEERKKNLGFTVTQLISAKGIDIGSLAPAVGGAPKAQKEPEKEKVLRSGVTDIQHDIDQDGGQHNAAFEVDETDRSNLTPKLEELKLTSGNVQKPKKKRKRKTNKIRDGSVDDVELLPDEDGKEKKKKRRKKKKRKKSEEIDDVSPPQLPNSFTAIKRLNSSVVPMTKLLDSSPDSS